MREQLLTVAVNSLSELENLQQTQALNALETGNVIYFPNYAFSIKQDEQGLMTDSILDGKHKNVSFDYLKQRLGGYDVSSGAVLFNTLMPFMQRFAAFSKELVDTTFPHYSAKLIWGRTSYRPAQIKGRVSSKRKDDTRLHVDAFPATPVNGHRILRVFCNINPDGEPRIWNLGEPFSTVLKTFAPQLPTYSLIRAKVLHWIKATKTLRSAYDHDMLFLHDKMKLDDTYQQHVAKQKIAFPSQSSWIVFTDQVSHAALSGQHLLEQTFYLPVSAMKQPSCSPLHQLAKLKDAQLENYTP